MFVTVAPGFKLEIIEVPAGEFNMGSLLEDEITYEDEKPIHPVFLSRFVIGKFPVTVEQYQLFLRERALMHSMQEAQVADHPVRRVSWFETQAFCRWVSQVTGLDVRLPSEAEWEKAARGTDGRLYPWGDTPPDSTRGNYKFWTLTGAHRLRPNVQVDKINPVDTTPVGQFSPQGDSPYGCADMSGNVWEWTNSLYRKYPYDPDDDRETDQDLGMRVARGGSFLNYRGRVRCTSRLRQNPDNRLAPDIGFRVCASIH